MQPVSKVQKVDELRYSSIHFDMDDVDLFLQIGRKCIDNGRKAMQRLTKIEANLRELRQKYVVS